jgi:hypothetical protein
MALPLSPCLAYPIPVHLLAEARFNPLRQSVVDSGNVPQRPFGLWVAHILCIDRALFRSISPSLTLMDSSSPIDTHRLFRQHQSTEIHYPHTAFHPQLAPPLTLA